MIVFIWLSCLVAIKNNIKTPSWRWKIFYILFFIATKRLNQIKKNHKLSSLVFIARCQVPSVLKSIFIFQTLTPNVCTMRLERKVQFLETSLEFRTREESRFNAMSPPPWDIKRKSSLKCKIFNDFFSYILFSPTSHLLPLLCRPFL